MTARVIVDTDVFSYIVRSDTRAERYLPALRNKKICISFITAGELLFGAYLAGWGRTRFTMLRNEIHATTQLGYIDSMPDLYGRLAAACQRQGRVIAINDAWIAATALAYDIPLITGNVAHFRHVPGINLLTI